MTEQSSPEQKQPDESASRHPGMPPTAIEEEALKANAEVKEEQPAKVPDSGPVKILNDRRRPITNHHGKGSF